MTKEEKVSYDDGTEQTEPAPKWHEQELHEDLGKKLEIDVPPEWYEQEINRLRLENEKLKKLVDILLEREMYEN